MALSLSQIKNKALSIRIQTLQLHGLAPEARIASSLSNVEVMTALYYGGFLRMDPKKTDCEKRDRFILSKGHGGISLYPILADLGFFDSSELARICQKDSFLGGIPDCIVPGFETTNGSLGHGLGVGCGMAIALKQKKSKAKVVVMVGDGELNEGSVWEAIMFASHHQLDNLYLIVDQNEKCMLDYCKNVVDLASLKGKMREFGWKVHSSDGHCMEKLLPAMKKLFGDKARQPKVLIAKTVKGKGVPRLEKDPLCHIKSMNVQEIEQIVRELQS